MLGAEISIETAIDGSQCLKRVNKPKSEDTLSYVRFDFSNGHS
jgi:hypothetical protein